MLVEPAREGLGVGRGDPHPGQLLGAGPLLLLLDGHVPPDFDLARTPGERWDLLRSMVGVATSFFSDSACPASRTMSFNML